MISSHNAAFVWIHLPGDSEPTLCGRFTFESGPVGKFVYGKRYLANPDAIAIDPIILPLVEKEFATTSLRGVFGVLHDAMPDDWGRYVIEKVRGHQEFPIGVMLNTLNDAIGNLSFGTTALLPPDRFIKPLPVEKLDKARAIILRLDEGRPFDGDLEGLIQVNTAMGGARPKVTVEFDGALWIAKFPSAKDKGAPVARLEAAALKLAHMCGIDVPQAKVVLDDTLLVKRFDRRKHPSGDGWCRDSFLSARTLFSSRVPSADFSGSYARLANELSRYSSECAKDRRQLYRRMVFNVLIGNTDDHDRNHGLLADDEPGSFRLSPAYDMVPQHHSTLRRFHAMALGDGQFLATRENVLSDVRAFGLSVAEGEQILSEVEEIVAKNWLACFSEQGVAAGVLEGLAQTIGSLPESQEAVERMVLAKRQVHCESVESVGSRLDALPRLQQQAGAAYTLHQVASKALQGASGDAMAVDWAQVHQDVFDKAVGQDRQPVAKVLEAIKLHSPGAVTPQQIAAVEAMAETASNSFCGSIGLKERDEKVAPR